MKNYNKLSTKDIALLGILLALHILLSSFYIPLFDNNRIMFSFFIKMVVGIIIRPKYAIGFGFIADIIGHIIHPLGPYFFGYTLTSICSCYIFSLCLYNKRITYLNLIGSKLLVNVLCNVIMNSIWSYMLLSNGYIYYLIQSLFKNVILFPLEVGLIILLFKLLLPMLKKYKIIEQNNITII